MTHEFSHSLRNSKKNKVLKEPKPAMKFKINSFLVYPSGKIIFPFQFWIWLGQKASKKDEVSPNFWQNVYFLLEILKIKRSMLLSNGN